MRWPIVAVRCQVVVIVLLLMAGLLTACEQVAVATPATTTVSIAGATSMHPVLRDLTAAFGDRHPNVAFTVRGGGSTVGEEQVRRGRIDLAASTLPPSADAQETGALIVPIGLDGIAIIVHASNPLPNLTLQQLHDIYSGRMLTWEEAGGASAQGEILPVSREDGSGTRAAFEERVMGDASVTLTAVVMPTSADVVDYVASTPNAVGYVSRSYLVDGVTAGTGEAVGADRSTNSGTPTPAASPVPLSVRMVPIDGELPTVEAIRGQRYPLVQPLYLISRANPATWPRQFIDFVLGPAGQEIVGHYHVPVR